jgi:hypothetical protein
VYVDQGGSSDVIGDALERELEGMAEKSVVVSSACAFVKSSEAQDIREVSCRLFVFRLLFRQEPCEGDDVGVDRFPRSSAFAVTVGSHLVFRYFYTLGFLSVK